MPDYAGRNYEFVSKSELRPVRKVLDSIIKDLHNAIKPYKVTFEHVLVGSAGRNLVTRVIGGNTGFDFDYNLSIQKNLDDYDPKELKTLFAKELQKILQNPKYVNVNANTRFENKTRSMKIKFIDTSRKRVTHSCDFAIVIDYENQSQQILVRNGDNYKWNEQPLARNYGNKVSNLIANGLWEEVKAEYIKIKNNNRDEEKDSFSLYYETINNVYNRYNWK